MTRDGGVALMFAAAGVIYGVDWTIRICRAIREAHKEIIKAEQAYAADLKRQAAGLPSIVAPASALVSYTVDEPALDGDRPHPSPDARRQLLARRRERERVCVEDKGGHHLSDSWTCVVCGANCEQENTQPPRTMDL